MSFEHKPKNKGHGCVVLRIAYLQNNSTPVTEYNAGKSLVWLLYVLQNKYHGSWLKIKKVMVYCHIISIQIETNFITPIWLSHRHTSDHRMSFPHLLHL